MIGQSIAFWGLLFFISTVKAEDGKKEYTTEGEKEYTKKKDEKREAFIFAMEYVPISHVRTDPIISQKCLSDHVHTFYGPPKVHPSVTYEELRSTDKVPLEATSGNVLENQSLYWHPTFYRTQENGAREVVEPDWTTIYYAFEKGVSKSFPEGFRMITNLPDGLRLVCYDDGNVGKIYDEEKSTDKDVGSKSHFPSGACKEMTASIVFPTCWDGKNLDSYNHNNHVSYAIGQESGQLDTFGGAGAKCPESHPVKLPQILLFLRFMNWEGQYELSNGNGEDWHADYVMGWDEKFLQEIIDDCDIIKDIPCGSTRLRDIYGDILKNENSEIARFIKNARVPMANTSCNTEESVNKIDFLPRGGCVGDIISTDSCEQPEVPIDFLIQKEMKKDEASEKDEETDTTSSGVTISTLGNIVAFFLSAVFATAMN